MIGCLISLLSTLLLLATAAVAQTAKDPTVSTLPNTDRFWTMYGQDTHDQNNSALVTRMAGRTLFGAATANDAIYNPTSCAAGCYGGFSDLDWLGQLHVASLSGGPAIGTDTDYAQVAVLADPKSQAATLPVPVIGLLAAVETLNGVHQDDTNYSTPRALEAIAVANQTTKAGPITAWALYDECHRWVVGAGSCYGAEIQVVERASAGPQWNPYDAAGYGTVGVDLGCGAGLPRTGEYDCKTAMYISANPTPFQSGLIFFKGSIDSVGPGSSYSAIQLPYNYAEQWYASTGSLMGQMYGDSSGAMHIDSTAQLLQTNSNIYVPDGAVLGFGAAGSTTYLGGSQAGEWVAVAVNGTEQLRVTGGGIKLPQSSQWAAPSACGSLPGATKCLAIVDPNGNPMYLPAYGRY